MRKNTLNHIWIKDPIKRNKTKNEFVLQGH